MFTRDWFALDASEILTQFELVDYLVSAEPRRYWSKGQAVRVLLDRSIEHVIAHIQKSDDKSNNRVAEFLQKRKAGISIAAIGRDWGMTREHLSRSVNRQAIQLVTERFLTLARQSVK